MLPRERIPGLPTTIRERIWERIRSLPRWVWFFVFIALIPPLTAPVAGLARYTTTSSEYCLSCHGAGDTPDKAVKSLVHPGFDQVSCVDCHAKTGQVVYEGYVNGFAAEPERVSANCTRCHEDMPIRSDIQGFKFNFGNINVTHKAHLERGATCATCHANVAHDLTVPQTNRPQMETCQQCHSQNDSCIKCHPGGPPSGALPLPAAEPTGLETDGRILYQRTCSSCHGSKGDQVQARKLNDRVFLDQLGDKGLFDSILGGHGVMPGFGISKGGQLSDDQITAIVGYLKVMASTPTAPINGQAIFESRCVVCHGQDGNKMEVVRLGDAEFLADSGQALLFRAVSEGQGGMPAFSREKGGPLSAQQIDGVLAYLKGLSQKIQSPEAASAQGRDLFDKSCASCHGGNGDALASANLGSKSFLEGQGQEQLIKATEEGKGGMPALGSAKGGSLSRDQVTAIIQYLLGAAK